MIVSHKHRFIFLKTRKTAGTSIEIALSRHCGPNDIITVISEADEQLRREWGGIGPQNCTSPPLSEPAYNHMSAARVRRIVGPEVWESYFKFVVERNPWEVVLSSYYYARTQPEPPPTFEDFLADEDRIQKLARNQLIYRLNKQIAVDKVCLYEDLATDLEDVWQRIGLPTPVHLPSAKRRSQSTRRSRKEEYGPDGVEVVRAWFERTIHDFGYRF